MRRVPAIAMSVALTAAGLAAAAWQGPRALDWSHLEPRIQDALGREISLDGPVRLALLPRPELTVAGVSAIDIKVREARAILDAGALLAGRLEVEALDLSGVELTLDRSLIRPLPPLPARRIRIRDGSVAFGETIVPVEMATLTVRGPDGPYRLEARTMLHGRRHLVSASVGVSRDEVPVTVSLGSDGFEAVAVGAVAKDPAGGFVFSGRLAARGEAAPGWKGSFDAKVRLGRDGAELAGVDAVVDDERFTGVIDADWRAGTTVDARLSTGLLLFDGWWDRLPQLARATAGAELRLALDAGAVKFGERTARQVEIVFRRDADGVALEGLAAALPGGTRVKMAGRGHDRATISLKTKNLRALLLWLGVDAGAVEETRLRGLEARGQLRLAGKGLAPDALRTRLERADFAFEELRVRIDGARIEGRLVRRQGRFEARLAAADLLLDPYRAVLDDFGMPPPGTLHLDLARTRLFGVAAERLELAAEIGEDGGVTVRRLVVADAGGLSGEGSGSFGPGTASFRVSGRMADLDRSAGLYGFPLPAAARGLGAVRLEGRGEGPVERLAMEFQASAGGRLVRLSGDIAERARFRGRLEAEGPLPPGLQLSDNDGPAMLTASVSARRGHAEFDDIDLRLGRVRAQGNGSILLNGARPAARLALEAARVDLPAPSPDVPVWRRRPLDTGQFGAFDLDLDLRVGTLGIGGEALDELRLDLSLAPEAWVVNAARAGWRGGRLAFDGGYLADDGRARLKLELRDSLLPEHAGLGPSGARADAFLDLAAEGRSPYGLVSTLSGALRFDVSGGRLNGVDPAAVRDALDGASSSAELLRRLRQALVSGDGPLVSGRFEAAMQAGVARPVAGIFALAGGQVAVSGSADLQRRLIDLAGRLAFPDRPELPPLGFSVAGPLHDPDRLPEIPAVEALLLSEGLAGLVR